MTLDDEMTKLLGELSNQRRDSDALASANEKSGRRAAFLFKPASFASIVAIDLLAALVALLRLDRQRGDRAGVEALQRDRLAGLLAIAVGAFLDALQRRIDLGDQLALAVAGAQFDGAIGFRGGTVGEIGMVGVFLLQDFERLARFAQDVVLPGDAAWRGSRPSAARS